MLSVLIVAHNEEAGIASCLDSLMAQSLRPDEIVVIAHNSTDATADIARRYPVKVIEYAGPTGAIHARIKGFESVSGDIVACIDADGHANAKWLERLVRMLEDPKVSIVGSVIAWHGTMTMRLASMRVFYIHYPFFRLFGFPEFLDVWGGGFAVRKRDYDTIGRFASFMPVHAGAGLDADYWPDDFYLTARLRKFGKIRIALGACVSVVGKEKSEKEAFLRTVRSHRRGKRLLRYLKSRGM